MTAPRPLRVLFFVLLAVNELRYSALRGPTLFGVAEAVMGLLCAAVAVGECIEAWDARYVGRGGR